ncbi:uncharacterized protein LOC105897807 [Clupea harengus]|uniref:Uncharacterized protein LOC105897807 n=1 Tax=Clupea harengus TaxID=7950 RepID=A0A6P3VSU4_CLUHA|nr:uncharacterized protein LOC105897807 [Clupea harengus]
MTNSIGDQTPPERREVFDDYLKYYDQVWQHGNVKVCKERQVTEKAKYVLLSESNPEERFTTFDFYHTALECVSLGVRDCRGIFNVFIKAAEVLETLCVNLFLFPWKKEIKTIKTFTGPFVYCVQPVLPNNVVRGILESIGYHPESDTEYRLTQGTDQGADHDRAKTMGFELFLARMECEYLLEVMGQRAHEECLEILQRRAAPLGHSDSRATAEEEPPRSESSGAGKDDDGGLRSETSGAGNDDDGLRVDSAGVDAEDQPLPDVLPLADPAVAQAQDPSEGSVGAAGGQERHQPLQLEAEGVLGIPGPSGRHSAGSDMSEYGSIQEMRKNYPDLAIRQKPIFRNNRGGSYPMPGTKARGRLRDDGDALTARSYAHTSDLSGPQSFSVHTESLAPAATVAPGNPLPKPSLPDDIREPQPLVASSSPASMIQYRDTAVQSAVHRSAQEGVVSSPDQLLELSKRISQLCVSEMSVDEPLKYPIEETAQVQPPCTGCHDCHDCHRPTAAAAAVVVTAPPAGSPRDNSHQPILCSPSPLPICSISGCSSCAGPDAAQTWHGCGPDVVHHGGLHAGEDTIKEPPSSIYMPPSPLGLCSPLLGPLAGHLPAAAAPPLGQPGVEGRGSAQQPEDDLLQTYVLVDVLVEQEKK